MIYFILLLRISTLVYAQPDFLDPEVVDEVIAQNKYSITIRDLDFLDDELHLKKLGIDPSEVLKKNDAIFLDEQRARLKNLNFHVSKNEWEQRADRLVQRLSRLKTKIENAKKLSKKIKLMQNSSSKNPYREIPLENEIKRGTLPELTSQIEDIAKEANQIRTEALELQVLIQHPSNFELTQRTEKIYQIAKISTLVHLLALVYIVTISSSDTPPSMILMVNLVGLMASTMLTLDHLFVERFQDSFIESIANAQKGRFAMQQSARKTLNKVFARALNNISKSENAQKASQILEDLTPLLSQIECDTKIRIAEPKPRVRIANPKQRIDEKYLKKTAHQNTNLDAENELEATTEAGKIIPQTRQRFKP